MRTHIKGGKVVQYALCSLEKRETDVEGGSCVNT